MIPFLTALFAKPVVDKLPEAAKGKIATVNKLLTGGSGDDWIALERQQSTLPLGAQHRSRSGTVLGGKACDTEKDSEWLEFDWSSEEVVGPCTAHFIRWRFYRNGLICLELVASNSDTGLDSSDLLGHAIELSDETGFLIEVWSAASLLLRGVRPHGLPSVGCGRFSAVAAALW